MTSRKKARQGRTAQVGRRSANSFHEQIWIASLFVVAWIHRILFLRSNSDHTWGFSIFYEGDAETFYNYARSILADARYDLGVPFHPPFFAHVLAFAHQLVGAADYSAKVPQETVRILLAGIGAAIIPALYVLVRPYLGRTVAAASALLCLYHFGLNVLSVAPVSESLYLWLLLSSLIIWSRLGGHPWGVPASASNLRQRLERSPILRLLSGIGLGVLLGLLSLTRAEGISIAVLLLLIGSIGSWVSDRRDALRSKGQEQKSQRRGRVWIAASLALLIVLIPWTIRNARNLSQLNEGMASQLVEPLPTFVPLTIYGPLNFALANNELATGEFSRSFLASQSTSASLELRDPEHLRFLLHGYEIGGRYIREHPLDWALLVGEKWKNFFGSLRLGWTQWNVPGGLDGVRRPVDIFVPDSTAGVWFLLPWLGLGTAVLRRAGRSEGRWLVLVIGFTGLTAATTAFFFGYARLGLLCIPFWMTLVAAALVWLSRLVLARGAQTASKTEQGDLGFFRSRGFQSMLAIMVLLLLIEAWGATGNRDFVAKGSQLEGATHLNPHDTMRLTVIRD